jgi:DNA-binding MarR family transcriptional regulator
MNVPTNLGADFTRLTLWNHRIERLLAAAEDIPVNELHCLMLLFLEKPASASLLAKCLGIRDTSLSKLLRKLESRSAIKRVSDSADRRIEHVFLTDAGTGIAERTLVRASEIGAQILADLPEERREQFVRCLNVITSSGGERILPERAASQENTQPTPIQTP